MPALNEFAQGRPQTVHPFALSPQVEKKLLAYAAAASSAGVGILALAPPAEARIVYTQQHQKISGSFELDLNHDGVVDFVLSAGYGGNSTDADVGPVYQGNRIWGTGQYASALPAGVRVGPGIRFQQHHYLMALIGGTPCGSGFSLGAWRNVTNRYLGLKFFSVNGDIHYGWARLSVRVQRRINAILTGYAYETVPNKPIMTGKTKGGDVITRQPATLGHLARGASAIPAWGGANSVK